VHNGLLSCRFEESPQACMCSIRVGRDDEEHAGVHVCGEGSSCCTANYRECVQKLAVLDGWDGSGG
jgi:hypothetical protein